MTQTENAHLMIPDILQKAIQVRRYASQDFVAVKSLIQDLARLYSDDYNDYLFTNQMQVRALDASTGTFVATCNGEVKGCAFADTERDPRGVLHGRISNINISPEWQGKGLGSDLVQEAIQYLSAICVPNIWANVNPNNAAMLHIFEAQGFWKFFKVMEKYVDPLTPMTPGELNQGGIQYRTIKQDDLPMVKDLLYELSHLFDDEFNPYWFDLYVQKFFQDRAANIFIAENNGKVAGMAFAEVRRDPVGFSYGYISNIMVDSSAQGKGIGSELLHHASYFLSHLNISKIWANVNYNSEIMQNLFEKQGFKHKFSVLGYKINSGAAC